MTDWNKSKVVDLRAELKKRGLPQTGLKPALVARLVEADNEDGTESETTVQDDALNVDPSAATSPDTVSPTQPHSAEVILAETPHPSESNAEPSKVATESESEDVDGQHDALTVRSVNTPQISQPEPERSALPSVEPLEAIEDRQKRKRRSQTPQVSSADVARKRFRVSDEAEGAKDEIATTKSEEAWVEKHNAVNETEVVQESGGAVEAVQEDSSAPSPDKKEIEIESKPTVEITQTSAEQLEDSLSRARDSRFKDLFSHQPTALHMGVRPEKSAPRDSVYEATDLERFISPAVHPATAALYIRDFMRPLNPAQLKSHLADLATSAGGDVDPDVIVDFYLDPIRTHAFILFKNVSSASRVRSALHDRIWPDERTRKPLWIDFIPSDMVKEWIEVEEESNNGAGRGSGRKWEVYYDVDEDRHVTASLQEASNVSKPQHLRKPSMQLPTQAPPVQESAPAPRRGIEGAPSGPRAEQGRDAYRGQQSATNLATLDQLFKSTQAKPVLYWEPVSKSIADKRLDAMEDATSKRYTRGGPADADIKRYTFEDGNVLVDRGPELFGGIRPPRGFRGPPRRGAARFSSGRGGYGGPPDRGYDSYRGGGADRRGSRDEWAGRRDSRDDRRY